MIFVLPKRVHLLIEYRQSAQKDDATSSSNTYGSKRKFSERQSPVFEGNNPTQGVICSICHETLEYFARGDIEGTSDGSQSWDQSEIDGCKRWCHHSCVSMLMSAETEYIDKTPIARRAMIMDTGSGDLQLSRDDDFNGVGTHDRMQSLWGALFQRIDEYDRTMQRTLRAQFGPDDAQYKLKTALQHPLKHWKFLAANLDILPGQLPDSTNGAYRPSNGNSNATAMLRSI